LWRASISFAFEWSQVGDLNISRGESNIYDNRVYDMSSEVHTFYLEEFNVLCTQTITCCLSFANHYMHQPSFLANNQYDPNGSDYRAREPCLRAL